MANLNTEKHWISLKKRLENRRIYLVHFGVYQNLEDMKAFISQVKEFVDKHPIEE